MTNPKDIHPIVMKVLDELSEKYFIHKRPTIKKSDNWELGWGGTECRGVFVKCGVQSVSGWVSNPHSVSGTN
jgi:hypothetical protein